MIDVFLSASIPLPKRDRRFFDTADVLSIREAIKALVEVVLPVGRITSGGHPAITPLLALFIREAGLQRDRVSIFQSEFYSKKSPADLAEFVDVQFIPAVGKSSKASLSSMRSAMITSRQFSAAVVIGGMDGVFEEVDIFKRCHPQAPVLPIGSTGAAAAIIHANGGYDDRLGHDLTYSSLFRRMLPLS